MKGLEDYHKYCKTGDEDYFNSFIDKTSGLIANKIFRKGFSNSEFDDVFQEVYLFLWKSTKNYDEEKGLKNFVESVINKSIAQYIQKINRHKNKFNRETTSLNTKPREDRDEELADYIPDSIDIEKMFIIKQELEYHFSEITKLLTKMEKNIYKYSVLTVQTKGNYGYNYDLIKEKTGYNTKQIDNAKDRTNRKIKKYRREVNKLCRSNNI